MKKPMSWQHFVLSRIYVRYIILYYTNVTIWSAFALLMTWRQIGANTSTTYAISIMMWASRRLSGMSRITRLAMLNITFAEKLSAQREIGHRASTTILLGNGLRQLLKWVCLYCRPECCEHHQYHPHRSSVPHSCSGVWSIDDNYSGGRSGLFCFWSRYSTLLQRSLQETRRSWCVTACMITAMF